MSPAVVYDFQEERRRRQVSLVQPFSPIGLALQMSYTASIVPVAMVLQMWVDAYQIMLEAVDG
jgi:hypothetical protein